MTHIVRLEEIDGQLILRLPDDMAKQLGWVAGGDVKVMNGEKGLLVEPLTERVQRQIAIGRRIIEENHVVLAALAK